MRCVVGSDVSTTAGVGGCYPRRGTRDIGTKVPAPRASVPAHLAAKITVG